MRVIEVGSRFTCRMTPHRRDASEEEAGSLKDEVGRIVRELRDRRGTGESKERRDLVLDCLVDKDEDGLNVGEEGDETERGD